MKKEMRCHMDRISIYFGDGNVGIADIKKYGSNAFLLQLRDETVGFEVEDNFIIDVMIYREGVGWAIVGKGSHKYTESIYEAVKEYKKR
jgi:hypothetical protein